MLRRTRSLLPTGVPLSDGDWQRRHRGIVMLLALHVLIIPTFGSIRGYHAGHMVLETLPILLPALVASRSALQRSVRMASATFGLLSSSAILVHLSGGVIEMHFHFFVMVAVITLYQSWMPFLFAIGYVVLHHGVMGVIDPSSVYNHASAIEHPWRWAAIHGGFILAESAACLTAWRLNEVSRVKADESHQQLAALVQSSDDAIVGLLPNGRILSWNPGAEKLFGYSETQAASQPFTMLMPADRVESESQILDAFLETNEVQRYETRSLRKDGTLVNVAVTLSPIRDEWGSPIGASAIARDITEKTLAEREREESLSLLSATLESTADGILVVDLDGHIVSFNQKFLELWQIPEEIVASGDDDRAIDFVLGQLKYPDEFVAQVKNLYAKPRDKSFDVLEFNDGRYFERYSLPQEVGDRSVGRVWSFRDVTDREQSKRALQDAFQREREAAESLRGLDEMKNAFLEAVSHELRTPLTSVLGAAVTLETRRGSLSSRTQTEMFQSLVRNARKLERLLSDLLDLDRMLRGVLQPSLEPTDIASLIRASVDEVESKDHHVQVRVEDVIASIDASKIQRIVENLVANAVKYTPSDTNIWVTANRSPEGILISVEDDGPGVAEDFRKSAFEPFRRGGQNLHSPGTGIGLSLVARFAELHGGKAWIEDRVGGGAAFRVLLPCVVTEVSSQVATGSA
ncbi:MAG: PAS domain S-box protein [Actinomycetota bacterium]|nr:PAS domain S-box protein [Actinomycetota bacterium]